MAEMYNERMRETNNSNYNNFKEYLKKNPFQSVETPNELHNRGALTDAHAHAALIILIVVKRDQYSLLSRQLK